jgi:virulence factor Mce-like protein
MSTRRQRINPMVAGIIAGVVIAIVVGVMAKINIDFAAPWARTHTMTAQVTDADGIGVSSDVRIAGRLVGQVTAVRSRGSYSDVTFHIDDSEWPVPQDSTASIRLATLLGQKYVEIQPGTDTAHPYADNAVIPQTKTKDVVDFDQILKGFDQTTRDHLTNLIKTLGPAFQGQEGTLQQLLPDLRALSVHSTTGTAELVTRDPELNSILINLGTTADQLNKSRDDFAGVIDNLNSINAALANNQGALRGQIRNVDNLNQTTDAVLGNGGAAEFNAGLVRLNGVARQLDDLVTQLVPKSINFQQNALQSAISLIYRIGDATSQSNGDGYFLRQNLQSVDCTGLLPTLCTAIFGSKTGPSAAPGLPTLPLLGLPQLKGIPPLPVPLPPLPVPAPSLGPLPTLPPLPGLPTPPPVGGGTGSNGTPSPTPCLLGLICPPVPHSATTAVYSTDAQISLMWFLFGMGA